jgi:arylsulfatase A
MRRREFLKMYGIGVLLTISRPLGLVGSIKSRPPNIILIMADDLGYGDLKCYGSTLTNTPNLDRLAAGGKKFADFHSNGVVCSPTRAALLTGRYQQRSGIEGVVYANGAAREKGMSITEITFGDVLKSAGYTTGLFGKWHLGYKTDFNPVKQGFDVFRGYVSGNIDFISHIDGAGIYDWWYNTQKSHEEGYSTDLITKHAINFIKENHEKPFLAYIAHEAPHSPYQNRTDLPVRLEGQQLKENERKDIRQACSEMIVMMDEGIGEIVATIEKYNLEKNTFIFFCSDNGAVLRAGSNGKLSGAKGSLREGGHRVPAIAYWPGKIAENTVSDELVLSMDIFPTILSITKVEKPPDLLFDGIDISANLFENKKLPERSVFWRYRGEKATRKNQWKFYIDQNNNKYLFNLSNDLSEKVNLADTYPELLAQMEKEFLRWEKNVDKEVEYLTR